MVTVVTKEYASSEEVFRKVPYIHAVNLGESGWFYKVQIIGEYNQILLEYK